MYNMYSFILFLMSFIQFISSMILYYMKLLIIMEWNFFYLNSMEMNMFILIDWMSIMFCSTVMLISSSIYMYSIQYMSDEKFKSRFMYLLLLFIISMNLLILSPNLMSIMIGWDGLGLISFCLIIFYQNFNSLKSGMLTVMCNRMGDIGMLMGISLSFMFGSWNIMLYNNKMIILMIMLAAISKSAQIPFSLWLPAAMAAPTPVSALVHSSTLVTAGVYILIRFNYLLMNNNINILMMMISMLTLLMASMMAMFEFDFKKIIALSTLSQLSLMMMSLSMGLWKLAYFHMITHAMFKSLLFLNAGLIIHSSNNNQDIRMYGNLMFLYPCTSLMFMFSSLSLSGFPFLSGFYSKDLILENTMMFNNIYMYMFIISSILTSAYSFRLLFYLFLFNKNFYTINYNYENLKMILPMLILFCYSIIKGSMMYWLFFINMKLIFSNTMMKLILFMMLMMGIFISYMNLNMNISMKIKIYYYNFMMSNMMFLNKFFNKMYFPFMNISLKYNKMFEKGWLEMSISKFMFNLMNKNWLKIKFNLIFKMKLMIMLMFLIILMY